MPSAVVHGDVSCGQSPFLTVRSNGLEPAGPAASMVGPEVMARRSMEGK